MNRDQRWFEMRDLRARHMDRDAWIVLRAMHSIDNGLESSSADYDEEHFAAASASIPVAQRALTENTLGWDSLSVRCDHAPYVQDGAYKPADIFQPYQGDIHGTNLVMCQRGSRVEHQEWHIHPDLVLSLNLKREGDHWLAIDEGYDLIIRLSRNKNGAPALLDIRSSHLKDFLCAREEFLCISSYRSRELILPVQPNLAWTEEPTIEESPHQRWQATITPTTEHGYKHGEEIAILHSVRKNFDLERDVPEISASDEVDSSQFTHKLEGEELFRIWGELWKVDFVEPSENSSRVRGDEVASQVFFFTDGSGNKERAEDLDQKGRWLWFRPSVMNKALEYRGARLQWYTAQTGGIDFGSGGTVVFGVNDLGLVNVFAKDIGNSSPWQQQIWAGFNVIPDGRVSRELLMAQAEGEPAETQAPEAYLARAINRLNQTAENNFGFLIIKSHAEYGRLLNVVHRFRAFNEAGFYELAKDAARLTADSIDASRLQTVIGPKAEKWGSLKSLENVLCTIISPDDARSIMTPLVGVYKLRLADAHLPPAELGEAFRMVGASREEPWVKQGTLLLHSVVASLTRIAIALSSSTVRKPVNAELV